MNRFRASKYRNAAAKIPKKEEQISDLRIGDLKSSCGNHIKASQSFMAFNIETGGGGCLGVLPLGDVGRKDPSLPMIHAHSDFVTDMDFSRFVDGLLATCSYDNTLKLWQIPEEGIKGSLSSPLVVFPQQPSRVENVLFHPAASEVLASSCAKNVTVWDLQKQEEKFSSSNHQDLIQSISWKGDGSLLVTSSKDKKIRVLDMRSSSVVMEFPGVGGIKDSRVLWLGDNNKVLGTGFNMVRQREVVVWDTSNAGKPVQKLGIDSSTGTLMPFFDPDTNMLFLAGKGDSFIQFLEFSESTASCITPVSSQMMEAQHKGLAMVPKLALDVMSCEVVRLLQLTKSAVLPISYCVPRKSYREFHEDLFPDTQSNEAAMTADEWFEGANIPVKKISLKPAKQQEQSQKPTLKPKHVIETGNSSAPKSSPEIKLEHPNKTANVANTATKQEKDIKQYPTANVLSTETPVKPRKTFSGVRVSKFRHITGVQMHKSNNIENVRNLSVSIPGDSDGFQVNRQFIAFPLAGPGGQIAVVPLNKPCRLPDAGLPVIQCGSSIVDFAMDPFNNHQLATACESGMVSTWQVPEEGLTETVTSPAVVLRGHSDKPNIVQYHPTARGVLTSAAFDLLVKIWDINKAKDTITLSGHESQLFCMGWKSDGTCLATVARDNKLRIFDPRSQTSPLQSCPGPVGSRGARVVWGGPQGDWLIVTGFDKMNAKTVSVYDSRNLSEAMSSVQTGVSPSTLIPFYDEDSSVVFLSSKGETTVLAYEISEEPPYIFELTHFKTKDPYQAVGFLDKAMCDVKQVEVARAVKLNKTSIDLIMFQVPRVKTEYFQDDIFPDTRVWWEPAVSSDQWFAGENGTQRKLSLKPVDMKSLSKVPKEAPVAKKYDSRHELDEYKTDEQKKEELLNSMVEKLRNYDDEPLPQDLQEGVDDDEWDD